MKNLPTLASCASAGAAGLMLALAFNLPAHAQEETGVRAVLDEVIVTARKREESLQSVPVALTAFTDEAIRRQRIEGIADLALFTPGLVYQDINATLSIPVIRGLAQTTFTNDNNVGMFLNGIYLANNRTLDIGLVQLERIEVIKGPQSALYGQNSFAGAINYITRAPTEDFEAEVGGSVGTDELYELSGSVGGPLTDTLSGTFSAGWKEFDGTFENDNPATRDNLQGYESKGVTGALEFAPTDQFTARLFGYHVDLQNDLPAQYLVANNCGVSAFGTATFFCGNLPADGRFDLTTEGTYGRDAQNTIVALDLDYEFVPGWSVRSITARVRSESSSYLDFDFTSAGVPFAARDTVTNAVTQVLANTYLGQGLSEFTDISQELRIEFVGDRFEAMLGGYYYDSERSDASIAGVDTRPLSPTQVYVAGIANLFGTADPGGSPVPSNAATEDVRTIAVFGRLGYQATDKLRLSAELRWAEDEKQINRIRNFGAPVVNNANQEETFDFITPRLTVDYQLTDDVLLYGVYAEGTRTGGFNASASRNPGFESEQSFDPEENKTYEIGAKTQWLDRRLTANLALFRVDWDDAQLNSRSLDPVNIFSVIRNTGSVRSEGFELEASLLVTDNVLVGATYGYADPKYRDGSVDVGLASSCGVGPSICPNGTNIGGQQLGRTSKNQFSVYAQLDGQLTADWSWFLRSDVAYRDEQPTNAINTAFLDSFTIVNARLGVETDRYEIALWSKNLTDEAYLTASSNQPRFHVGSTSDVTFAYGRTVGLSALARFGR